MQKRSRIHRSTVVKNDISITPSRNPGWFLVCLEVEKMKLLAGGVFCGSDKGLSESCDTVVCQDH